jgi:hypothetical protein
MVKGAGLSLISPVSPMNVTPLEIASKIEQIKNKLVSY